MFDPTFAGILLDTLGVSFTSSSPSSPEVDPLAPQQHTSLLSSPSRRLGAIAGLLSGGLAVTIGMLVAALGGGAVGTGMRIHMFTTWGIANSWSR